eukprot:scaffold13633_cov64-Phaeocystis_antarctica.AAC.12
MPVRGPRTRPSQSCRANERVCSVPLFARSSQGKNARDRPPGAVVALISHRHRALSAPSPPARLLLPFLWWWSRVHNSDFLRCAVAGKPRITCSTNCCGAGPMPSRQFSPQPPTWPQRCPVRAREAAIDRAAVWQGSLIARHVPRRSWPRSAAATSAAQQHGATAAGPTAAVWSASSRQLGARLGRPVEDVAHLLVRRRAEAVNAVVIVAAGARRLPHPDRLTAKKRPDAQHDLVAHRVVGHKVGRPRVQIHASRRPHPTLERLAVQIVVAVRDGGGGDSLAQRAQRSIAHVAAPWRAVVAE